MYQQIDHNFHHWAWYMGHTSMSQFHTGLGPFLAVAGYCRKWWCINKSIMIFIIKLGILVILACANFIRGLSRFFTAVGYCRKWWCINKLIIIFIIELGIWVIRACPNFIRGCHVFWQLLVTVENDDVSTNWWLWFSLLSLVCGSYEHVPF